MDALTQWDTIKDILTQNGCMYKNMTTGTGGKVLFRVNNIKGGNLSAAIAVMEGKNIQFKLFTRKINEGRGWCICYYMNIYSIPNTEV